MKRRTLLGGAVAVAVLGLASGAGAQQPADQDRHEGMAQTGGPRRRRQGLAARHRDLARRRQRQGRSARPQRSSLWFYDDKSSASEDPGDLLESFWMSTRSISCSRLTPRLPTAPLMPLVKQRGNAADGELLVPGEQQGRPRHVVQQMRRGGPADSWAASFLDIGQKGRRQDRGAARSRTRNSRKISR